MDGADADLTDLALRDEIELVGDLVMAAMACSGQMDLAEVDSVLGVAEGRADQGQGQLQGGRP